MPAFLRSPKRLPIVTLALLWLGITATAAAATTGKGRYETADARASFSHVIAYRIIDGDTESTELVFAEKPLDTAAIARGMAGRGDDSTTSVLWETVDGAFLRLRLDADANAELYVYVPPGYNFNYSGKQAELKVNSTTRIEGSFNLDDTDMEGKPRRIELSFAADVGAADSAPPANKMEAADASSVTGTEAAAVRGTPLPPDGGEPGKVLLKAMAAQRAGDFDGMLAVSAKAQREQMLADRGKPELAAMIEMMKAMSSTSITIHGGTVDGDTAHVDFTGHYGDGGTSRGIATMRREEGRWAVEHIEETR